MINRKSSLIFSLVAFGLACLPSTCSKNLYRSVPLKCSNSSNQNFQYGMGKQLDLLSPNRSFTFGGQFLREVHSATISVGGKKQKLCPGSLITAGELLAVQQVLHDRSQTIMLDDKGVARCGSFSLNELSTQWSGDVIIPAGVTGIYYVPASAPLKFDGAIENYGTIYVTSCNSYQGSAGIEARRITNHHGALIATRILKSEVTENSNSNSIQNLKLQSSGNIENEGKIACDGDLILTSGGAIKNLDITDGFIKEATIKAGGSVMLTTGAGTIKNTGVIASAIKNISVMTETSRDILIEAPGGIFRADSGNICVRDSSYSGKGAVTILGGNYLANNLVVHGGNGSILGTVGEVSGRFDAYSHSTHLLANTRTLHIGDSFSACDPTYVNTGGDIDIDGALSAKESIAVIASGNILAKGDSYISTSNSFADQKAPETTITLVSGANVTIGGAGGGGKDTQFADASTLDILRDTQFATIDGPSPTGGSIILTGSTHDGDVIDSSSSLPPVSGNQINGGSVLLAAYSGKAGGMIQLPKSPTFGSSINAKSAHGRGGNVTFIAGAGSDGAASYAGTVLNSGAKLSIYTSQPFSSSSRPVSFGTRGGITSKNTLTFKNQNGIPCLSGSPGPLVNSPSVCIDRTDAATLSVQATGSVSILYDSNEKPLTMTESTVNSFAFLGGAGLSLSGDVKASGGMHVSGVSFFGTNGHTLRCAYFELRGDYLHKKDLTVGPDTNIVTTVFNVNGGNITINPEKGTFLIMHGGGSLTPVTCEMEMPADNFRGGQQEDSVKSKKVDVSGVIILDVSPELADGGIHFVSSGKSSAKASFNGRTIFRANSQDQSVVIDKNVEIACSKDLYINCPNVTLNGKISAKSTTYSCKQALAGGTIACTEGALDLSTLGALKFPGQNVTILSAEDITDGGKPLAINLGSGDAGGNLNLIAGFAFTPTTHEKPTGLDRAAYIIRSPQSGKGAIKLDHTKIETKGGLAGGNVGAYARGPISINSINTIGDQQGKTFPSESQPSGNVTLVGQGVKVQEIDSSNGIQGYSSRVRITSAQPDVSGTIVVQGGTMGGGKIEIGPRQGSIFLSKISLSVGTVMLDASGVDGSIGGCTIMANTEILRSGSGGIGTASSPIVLPYGHMVTANAGTSGDVHIKADSIWLSGDNSANNFNVTTTTQPLDIAVNAVVNGTTSVNLDSSGQYGRIRMQTGPGLIISPNLVMKTNGGDIGGNWPIYVKAKRVMADTGKSGKGKTYIINSCDESGSKSNNPIE